jgi:hypothetical protein
MSDERKKIPRFKTMQEEADFWDTHSINDYLPELKETRIEYLPKVKKGITLSTLVRICLIEKLQDEAARQNGR